MFGLIDDWKFVFVVGVVIFFVIFYGLNIKEMYFLDGVLCEGLLYEMEDCFKYFDICLCIIENLVVKYLVDLEYVVKVKGYVCEFLV